MLKLPLFVLLKDLLNLEHLLEPNKALGAVQKLNGVIFVMIRVGGRGSRLNEILPLELEQGAFAGPKKDLGHHPQLSDGTHKVHHVELALQLLVPLFV